MGMVDSGIQRKPPSFFPSSARSSPPFFLSPFLPTVAFLEPGGSQGLFSFPSTKSFLNDAGPGGAGEKARARVGEDGDGDGWLAKGAPRPVHP